jgi:hypothetical protein
MAERKLPGMTQMVKGNSRTVFQTRVTSCLIRTRDGSASAHDWTNREDIACTGLLPGPYLSLLSNRGYRGYVSASKVITSQPLPVRTGVIVSGPLCGTMASHARAFTRRNDFTAEPGETRFGCQGARTSVLQL